MPATRPFQLNQQALADLCRRYGVSRLSLFGSVTRQDFSANSDIDVLAEFLPEAAPSLFDLGGFQQDLSALAGQEVDLKTPKFLSKNFRDRVMAQAQVLYAA